MQPDGKEEFGELIGYRPDWLKFLGLNAGMQQSNHLGFSPTSGQIWEIGLKNIKVQMNMGIY